MSKRKKIMVLAGLVLAVAAAAILLRPDVKPIGKLSRKDVLEIRSAAKRMTLPGWHWFRRDNMREWPRLCHTWWTFRITDISEYVPYGPGAQPSGAASTEESLAIVRYRVNGKKDALIFMQTDKGWIYVALLP